VAHRCNADCGRLFPRKVLLLLGESAARGERSYTQIGASVVPPEPAPRRSKNATGVPAQA
jgi:hypothetical protein